MVIQHNMSAINANRQLGLVRRGLVKSAEKLSSGYRINRAADDAAGLAISEKMRRQVRGLNQGIANTEDGISLCQVADGALNEVHDMIQRLEELSVKAANGTNSDFDRGVIQDEVGNLLVEIDRISDTTVFNEHILFGGSDVEGKMIISQPTTPTEPTTPAETICGDFTVQGGTLGTDFDFDTTNGVLTIKSSTAIMIRNTAPNTATTNRIEVAEDIDANVILEDVSIDVSGTGGDGNTTGLAAFQVADNSKGNVGITLVGTNTLKSGTNCAGLQKNGEGVGIGRLTLSGTGNLTAVGGAWGGAGIGGGDSKAGSNIVISGGTVEAIGVWGGAGIGGGDMGVGHDIIISGGTVKATGGNWAAGIGGGSGAGIAGWGSGGNITISGGAVEATGGNYGSGIGGGQNGTGSNITISGGTVKATGGYYGAGIGGGAWGNGIHISINGGTGTSIDGTGAQKVGSGGGFADGTNNTVNGQPAPAEATDRNGGTFTWNLPDVPQQTDPPQPPDPPTPPDPPQPPATVEIILKSSKKWWIQSGCDAGDGIFVGIDTMNTKTLGLYGMDVTTEKGADDAMKAVDFALAYVSALRSKIGAQQNRLEHTIANEGNIVENTAAAESRIRDTDMAKEMVRYSNLNILMQAGQSMLAQANQSKQGVLSLVA